MERIICNMKGSRSLDVSREHLDTIRKYSLFSDLLDSNGIIDENVLNKLRMNIKSLLASNSNDPSLLSLCQKLIFHDNMKAFGLHQLLLLYIDYENELIAESSAE